MNRSKVCFFFLNIALQLLNALYHVLGPLHSKLVYYKFAWFDYEPRADDIFVITYPKSGTTWVLAMLYQLVSDGNMEFTHINHLFPLFGNPKWSAKAINGMKSPRVFKSHRTYDYFPRYPGRFVYICRNGMDVATSWHYYMIGNHQGGSFDEHFNSWITHKGVSGRWAPHIAEWLNNKRGQNVLYLKYEDMTADKEGTIRKIAAFCNIPFKEMDLPRILQRSSFEFLKKHEDQFDPATADAPWRGFFRKGKVNDGKTHLNPDQVRRLQEEYTKYLGGSNLNYF